MRYAVCLLMLLADVGYSAALSDYYIATASSGGIDSNAGTLAAPYLTFEKASTVIAAAGVPSGGTTVWIRGGNYYRTAFWAPASSSLTDTITYRAYPQEIVRIIGGLPLTHFAHVTDPTILARLTASAQANVYVTSLAAEGISSWGDFLPEGGNHGESRHSSDLFFNGQPMTVARYPDSPTWNTVASVPTGIASGGFRYSGDRPAAWAASTNIWVRGFWNVEYIDSTENVTGINTNTRVVLIGTKPAGETMVTGRRYFWFNVLEELDAPGEWYLDSPTGNLYFWPPSDITASEAVLSVPFAVQPGNGLLYLAVKTNLVFRGLIFDACAGYGINLDRGSNIVVQGCIVRNSGRKAVNCDMSLGSGGERILDCDVMDSGQAGIALISDGLRTNLTTYSPVVQNCDVTRPARWYLSGQRAISATAGVGALISHNRVQDTPEDGIMVSGNSHIVEYNELFNLATVAIDAGGTYTGGDWTGRSNTFRYNYWHDIDGPNHDAVPLYLDDWSSQNLIVSNIFSKVTYGSMLGGGRDNLYMNNIFYGATNGAIWFDSRGTWSTFTNDLYTTRLTSLQAMPSNFFRATYPLLTNVDTYYSASPWAGIPAENNTLATNIFYSGLWIATRMNGDTNNLTRTNNLADGTDPQFVDPVNGNFHLQATSPAIALGFQEIQKEKIGLQSTTARNELSFLKAHIRPYGNPPRYATAATARVGTFSMP